MARVRVLVVDDEQDMLEVCAEVLGKVPEVDLQVEKQSQRALERLAQESFDLLLTDVRMPRVGGLDLVRAARLVTDLRELPAVLMCTLPRGALRDRTSAQIARLPAVEMLDKPFTSAQLGAALGRLLTSR